MDLLISRKEYFLNYRYMYIATLYIIPVDMPPPWYQDEIPAIVDCPDPDHMRWHERRMARLAHEEASFDPEHYLWEHVDECVYVCVRACVHVCVCVMYGMTSVGLIWWRVMRWSNVYVISSQCGLTSWWNHWRNLTVISVRNISRICVSNCTSILFM